MNNQFDVLIIGGGVSGISCALVLGSAKNKPFASEKKIGIFTHQKSSALQEAIFNNAYGIPPGKLGSELLIESKSHLTSIYPHIAQITDEKVLKIEGEYPNFTVISNKNSYSTQTIIVGIGSANTFNIEGLTQFVEPHQKALAEKQRIQLKNTDHKVTEGIYVIGFFFPVVPKDKARIRVQLSAAHTKEQIDKAISSFVEVGKMLNVV
jgi:thioredoxin reductase